jgi:iron complex outermembrane receptor protein
MKILLLNLIFFFALTAPIIAQDKTGRINGVVTDAAGKPLEAATVQLLKAQSKTLVKAVLTGKDGRYELEKIAAGKYLLSVSAVAFAAKTAPVELVPEKMMAEVPAFSMSSASKELSGVTVTARKPLIEQKIDRTVVNVDAAPTNAGATAMEVLEKSPGISVDNDGNISLKGDDGRQTHLSFRGRFSERVEKYAGVCS